MTMAHAHLSPELLLDYWLHDTDADTTDAVDAHLFECDACGAALDRLVALGDGVRDALQHGGARVVTGPAFVERLGARGAQVRAYHLPHNGSVNCSVAPGDDFVATSLDAPLHGVKRLDIRTESSTDPGVRHEQQDVPFDALGGQVVFVVAAAGLRPLPAHTRVITLVAVDADGERELGRYVFHHRPFDAGGP